MPAYGTQAPVSLGYGDPPLALLNAESPANNAMSIPFCPAPIAGGGQNPIVFTAYCPGGTQPTLNVLGSNQDIAAQYVSIGSLGGQATSFYGDTGKFMYYCVQVASNGGNPVTVLVHM